VVADVGSSQVRIFSPAGEFILSLGGEGEGPGEFKYVETLNPWMGDSIAVFDSSLGRVTLIDPSGGLRTISLTGSEHRVATLRATPELGFIAAYFSYPSWLEVKGRYRIPYTIVRLSADGSVLDTLGIIGGPEGFAGTMGDAPLLISKDGELSVRRGDVVFGSADRMEFQRFRQDRAMSQTISVLDYDLSLTDEEIESCLFKTFDRRRGLHLGSALSVARRAGRAKGLAGLRGER
jgi:hypothetical protein